MNPNVEHRYLDGARRFEPRRVDPWKPAEQWTEEELRDW